MSGMKWIKFETELLDDVRLASLSDRAQLRYYQMQMLAGRLDADGAFMEAGVQLTPQQIAWKLRADPTGFADDLAAMRAAGLVRENGRGLEMSGFKDVQGDTWALRKERDAARKQKSRERHASVTADKPVTSARVTGSEEKRKEEKRIEKKSRLKDQPTTSGPAMVGGRSQHTDSEPEPADPENTPDQNPDPEHRIARVLRLAGCRKPELIRDTLRIVATRKLTVDDVMGALASAYADDSVKNRGAVAAYRIRDGAPDPHYCSPKVWQRLIPARVLEPLGPLPDPDLADRAKYTAGEYGAAVEH